MNLAVVVQFHLLDTDTTCERGVWCDRCLLPSAVRYRYATTVDGQFIGTIGTAETCADCGHTRTVA